MLQKRKKSKQKSVFAKSDGAGLVPALSVEKNFHWATANELTFLVREKRKGTFYYGIMDYENLILEYNKTNGSTKSSTY